MKIANGPVANDDSDVYEGDYTKLGNSAAVNQNVNQSTVSQNSSAKQPKMGKRHASFDILNGV